MIVDTTQEWKIDKGGALHLLPEIPDKSIDMILTDLPYGTTACNWDTIIPLESLWRQYSRIIKDKGVIVLTASQPFTSILVMSNIKMFRYEWIWNKLKPSNFQMMNFQCGRIHEHILIFSKSPAVFCNGNNMNYFPEKTERKIPKRVKKTYYGNKNATLRKGHTIKDMGKSTYDYRHPVSIYECSNANIKTKIHPTQKPVTLFEYLINTYTNPGDNVHDSCLGAGTTLEACVNLNRNCIGFEITDEWEWNYHKIMDSKKNLYKLSKIFKRKLS